MLPASGRIRANVFMALSHTSKFIRGEADGHTSTSYRCKATQLNSLKYKAITSASRKSGRVFREGVIPKLSVAFYFFIQNITLSIPPQRARIHIWY